MKKLRTGMKGIGVLALTLLLTAGIADLFAFTVSAAETAVDETHTLPQHPSPQAVCPFI